ncbi:hypothetical protein [uncultured Clostridium sp.]|uniref:hypothetical protein n=1 Tax=uncultured Clostridium sp. TaxID=59620 RepID=UPI0025DAAF45|nr:hypothetical protein [uncultured Clostridium sp.]
MFFQQSLIGVFICIFIMILSISYIVMAILVRKVYFKAIEDINIRKSKGEPGNSILVKETINTFNEYLKNGIRNINTEALIDEKIPTRVCNMENYMKYIISTVIVLGLLGTFMGLTGSIGSIHKVIDNIITEGGNIDEFLSGISIPLSSMSTAFFTSITGILSSILLRAIAIATYIPSREKYYTIMENYLDNILLAERDSDFERLLLNLTKNMNTAMRNMCDNISGTFERELQSLTRPINDFKKSVDALRRISEKNEIATRNLSSNIDKYSTAIESQRLNKFMDDMYRLVGDIDEKNKK